MMKKVFFYAATIYSVFWLFTYSSSANAELGQDVGEFRLTTRATTSYDCSTTNYNDCRAGSFYEIAFNRTVYWMAACRARSSSQYDHLYVGEIIDGVSNGQTVPWSFTCVPHPAVCENPLLHDPSGPFVDDNCPQACAPGYIDIRNSGYYQSGAITYDCASQSYPMECEEGGQWYQTAGTESPGSGYCVNECQHGSLNGQCLSLPNPEDEGCDASHPDFQGSIGWGNAYRPICIADNTCGPGERHTMIQDGDKWESACLPNDFQGPDCPAGSVTVMNDHGYICKALANTPDTSDPNDPPPSSDEQVVSNLDNLNRHAQNLENLTEESNRHLSNIAGNVSELAQMARDGQFSGGGGSGPGTGPGDGDGEGDGEGYGEAILEQLVGGREDLRDMLDMPDGLDTPTKSGGEIATEFGEGLSGIGLLEPVSFTNVSAPCPVYTLDIGAMGLGTHQMDFHCTFAQAYGSWLNGLMMAIYALIGIRIFMSA